MAKLNRISHTQGSNVGVPLTESGNSSVDPSGEEVSGNDVKPSALGKSSFSTPVISTKTNVDLGSEAKPPPALASQVGSIASQIAEILKHGPGIAPELDDPRRIAATKAQRALATASLGLIGLVEAQAIAGVTDPATAALYGVGTVGALAVADTVSNLFHYLLDNYDLGELAVEFKKHHEQPRAQSHEDFAVSVDATARIAGPLALGTFLLNPHPMVGSAVAILLGSAFYAQETHKNAHRPPDEVPRLFKLLQDLGLSVSLKEHNRHHKSPHADAYGIITGGSNAFMDKNAINDKASALIYALTGVEAHAWKLDPRIKLRAIGLTDTTERELDALADHGRPTETVVDWNTQAPYDYEGARSVWSIENALFGGLARRSESAAGDRTDVGTG
jgi:hypothetical protein